MDTENRKKSALTNAVVLSKTLEEEQTPAIEPFNNITITIKNSASSPDSERSVKVSTDLSRILHKVVVEKVEKEIKAKVKNEMDKRYKINEDVDNKITENKARKYAKGLANLRQRAAEEYREILATLEKEKIKEKELEAKKLQDNKIHQQRLSEKKLLIKEDEERRKTTNLCRSDFQKYKEQYIDGYQITLNNLKQHNKENIPLDFQQKIEDFTNYFKQIISISSNYEPTPTIVKQMEQSTSEMILFKKKVDEELIPLLNQIKAKDEENRILENAEKTKLENNVVNYVDQVNYNNNDSEIELLIKYGIEYEKACKIFNDDLQMKKIRSECKLGINRTTNKISSNSSVEHMMSINAELLKLLSHPVAQKFCILELAKKFLSLAEMSASIAVFPLAATINSLWNKFPEFGQIFLYQLYKEFPALRPDFIVPVHVQSIEEFKKIFGYRIDENSDFEEHKIYINRISSCARLYAAVLIIKPRSGDQYPHCIDNGWKLVTNLINQELRYPCETILIELLENIGFLMLKSYGKQFLKLTKILELCISNLEAGGNKTKLQIICSNIFEGKMLPPKGSKNYM